MADVGYSFNAKSLRKVIIEGIYAVDEECRNLEDRIKALRKRYKELNGLSIHLETTKQYGINSKETQDYINKELLAINEECSILEDKAKAWRVCYKELNRLSCMVEFAGETGRLFPEAFDLIDKYFGPDKLLGSGWVTKVIVG